MESTVALKVIGLAPSDSADAIDAALVELEGSGWDAKVRLLAYERFPFAAKMREAVSVATNPETGALDAVCALNFALGELFAAAAVDLAKDHGLRIAEVDLIGSHGPTVRHFPEQVEIGGMWAVSALEIGEAAMIAERTGVTVVADFRAADIAAGGRGGPLATYADFVLFRSANRSRAVQSIGDVGSVTHLPSGARTDQVIAFDTGPGSALIDSVVTRLTDGKLGYDAGGKLALAGKPDKVVLGGLIGHAFLQKRPPKSAGPDAFGDEFAGELLDRHLDISMEDMVATVTAFVAQSIKRGYERWLPKTPDDIIVGGSGATNPTLVRMLTEAVPRTKLYTHEDFGFNSDARNAVAFAILVGETMRMRPSNVPSATEAKHQAILGKIVPGRNLQALLGKLCNRKGEAVT
jgi:anhydro-N-acetylmuramic acid kinase